MFKTTLCDKIQEYRNWYYSDEESFWCVKPHFILEESKHFIDYKTWGSRTVIIEKGKEPRDILHGIIIIQKMTLKRY